MTGGAEHIAALLDGFRAPQCIYVAARLGIAERLAEHPMTPAALATATRADPDALHRLLRALQTVGLFAFDGDRWHHCEASRALCPGHPSRLHDRAIGLGSLAWSSWGGLEGAVRTGAPAFDAVHGASFFEHLERHPELAAAFGRTMSSWTAQTAKALVATHPFEGVGHLVDVGGGHGVMLDAVLGAHPDMSATLVDRPEVIDAGAPALGDAARERTTLRASNVFQDPLPTADAYLLSWILHDWTDAQCVEILARCRAANPAASVVVVELVLSDSKASAAARWFDLEMLVQTGGRERTQAEFEALFEDAGLATPTFTPTPGTHTIVHSANR